MFAGRLEEEGLVPLNGESNCLIVGGAQAQFIVQGNGLKDGAELVVGVRAFAENVQSEIDLGEGWDSDFAHAAIAAWLLSRTIFWLRAACVGRASSQSRPFCRSLRL